MFKQILTEHMNYTLPSLEHIALIKICITLWNHIDVRNSFTEFYLPTHCIPTTWKWQNVEDKLMARAEKLLLPNSLKIKVSGFIKPIGLQILTWMENFHEDLGICLPDELCWTPQGTVDYKKTAEIFVQNNRLDITTRYKLACIYCLESDIKIIWNEMPESLKKSFDGEENPDDIKQDKLVVIWTYDMKGEISKLSNIIGNKGHTCSPYDMKGQISKLSNIIRNKGHKCTPYQYAFQYAVVDNKVATEHFFQKLTLEEREIFLVDTALYTACKPFVYTNNNIELLLRDNFNVLCFLLSQMNEEQQAKIYKKYLHKVLRCFLNWPMQSFFIKIAKNMMEFLPEVEFFYLLHYILKKVEDGYKDYNYLKLFRDFWKLSPLSYKKYMINEGAILFNLIKVIEFEDWESTALLISNIKEATLVEKEFLILSHRGLDFCRSLTLKDNFDLLCVFIDNCISSEEKMMQLRKCFEKYIVYTAQTFDLYPEQLAELRKFNQFLDNLIKTKYKKRSMEEGDSRPAKRLSSLTIE